MKENKNFVIGQPIGLCILTSLPIIKIAQVENTIYYDDKRFIVGRILSFGDNNIYKVSNEEKIIQIITPYGFIISAHKEELSTEPYSKMDAFLKEQEQILVSQRLEPYGGKLINIDENCWFIPISI